MLEVENYDLVFTKDPESGEELLLLAIERTDIGQDLGAVDRIDCIREEGMPSLRISFAAGGGYVFLPNVEESAFAQLGHFAKVWICWMDEGDIVDDIQVPLAS